MLNYLKAAGGGVAMLLNFGHEPTYKRLVLGDISQSLSTLFAGTPGVLAKNTVWPQHR